MAKRRRTFLNSPKLLLSAVLLLAVLDAVGIYLLATSNAPETARATPEAPKPKEPPPPAMINPPPVEAVLKSGTLIVISKQSQHMFVFSDGRLWASTQISTGKRRHETPSGVFPILQKHKLHRSNIYSGAPMPYMQRLTWSGIAIHAGRVPGYPASHGCVRMPPAFAQSLFKLTNASATTVVIGDDPLETDVLAQQFALSARLPVFAALAPPPDPSAIKLAITEAEQLHTLLTSVILQSPPPTTPPLLRPPAPPITPVPPAAVAGPINPSRPARGQTIQLTAAASQAEAEAHWAQLLRTHPDLSRYEKTVEVATVKSRTVYRLRISSSDAQGVCAKLQSEGINCFSVN